MLITISSTQKKYIYLLIEIYSGEYIRIVKRILTISREKSPSKAKKAAHVCILALISPAQIYDADLFRFFFFFLFLFLAMRIPCAHTPLVLQKYALNAKRPFPTRAIGTPFSAPTAPTELKDDWVFGVLRSAQVGNYRIK